MYLQHKLVCQLFHVHLQRDRANQVLADNAQQIHALHVKSQLSGPAPLLFLHSTLDVDGRLQNKIIPELDIVLPEER